MLETLCFETLCFTCFTTACVVSSVMAGRRNVSIFLVYGRRTMYHGEDTLDGFFAGCRGPGRSSSDLAHLCVTTLMFAFYSDACLFVSMRLAVLVWCVVTSHLFHP